MHAGEVEFDKIIILCPFFLLFLSKNHVKNLNLFPPLKKSYNGKQRSQPSLFRNIPAELSSFPFFIMVADPCSISVSNASFPLLAPILASQPPLKNRTQQGSICYSKVFHRFNSGRKKIKKNLKKSFLPLFHPNKNLVRFHPCSTSIP